MSQGSSNWVACPVVTDDPVALYTLFARVLPPMCDGADWFGIVANAVAELEVAVPKEHAGLLTSGAIGGDVPTVIQPQLLDPAAYPGGAVPGGLAELLVDATARAVDQLVEAGSWLHIDDFEVPIAVVSLVSSHLGQAAVPRVFAAAGGLLRREDPRVYPSEALAGALAAHVHLVQLCGPDLDGSRLRSELSLYRRLGR